MRVSPVKQYNDIMFDIAHEHVTIGTRYSEGTEEWNLRDMVSEMQYVLDLWSDPSSIAWQDAHDDSQPSHKPWYREWINEKARMKRFVNKHVKEALTMKCHEGHCSRYD